MIDAISNVSVNVNAVQKPVASSSNLARPQPQLESAALSQQLSPSLVGTAHVRVDNELNMAILEFRSSVTGDVVRQFPTEAQIRAFNRASEIEARAARLEQQSSRAPAQETASDTGASEPVQSTAAEAELQTSGQQDVSSAPAPQTTGASSSGAGVDITSDSGSVPSDSSSTQTVTA